MRPIVTLLLAIGFALATIAASQAESITQQLECKAAPAIGPNVIVCIERLDQPLAAKDILALLGSGLAVLLATASLIYTYRKDVKTRQQSIKDDFWIRMIITPIAIEPLMKEMTALIALLPDDCTSPKWQLDAFQAYAKEFTPKKQLLTTSLFAFSLLDKSLSKQAIEHLDNIEDLVVNYCGANASKTRTLDGKCKLPRTATQSKITEELLALLDDVRAYQLAKI